MRQLTNFGENRTFFPREGGPRIPKLMPRCHGQVPVSLCSELTFSFVAFVRDAIASSYFRELLSLARQCRCVIRGFIGVRVEETKFSTSRHQCA